MRNKKKILKPLLVSSILFPVLSAIGVGIWWNTIHSEKIDNFRGKKPQGENNGKKQQQMSNQTIFPKIEIEGNIEEIQKDRYGIQYLSSENVLKIIKNIVSRLKTYEGKIEFDYEIIEGYTKTDTSIIIYIKYISPHGTEEQKQYKVFLD
ncbi:MHO_1590 family protein [Mycoplasma hafezii]|uniref:MHO_1590 family protein n=1 Tax=Mycoplasma hafezii TaxID=525886 RepID=UPI003CF43A0E